MKVSLGVDGPGYSVAWDPSQGHASETRFYLHRLAAVAEYGFDTVAEMDIHHADHPWVNDPAKLEPVDPGTHRGWNLPGFDSPARRPDDRPRTDRPGARGSERPVQTKP